MMHLYSAGRADLLAGRLAEMLVGAPPDPMEAEWVGVSSQGMRRWLLLELARHLGAAGPAAGDGVAANFSLPLPGSLRIEVLEAGRPDEDLDPWSIDRLVWSLLSVARTHQSDPALAAFNQLPDGASRYGKARRVADLFDRYHVHRPHMVQQWAAGHDVGGLGRPIAAHHAWQPHLWRLVKAHIGTKSPPERWPGLLHDLRAGRLALELPERITLFGLTSLPGGRSLLDLCQALAVEREVHLYLLEPTHFDGRRLAALPLRELDGQRIRSEDTSDHLADHPLLRSWGRPHREASILLADALGDGYAAIEVMERPAAPVAATLLARLQQDIATNRAPDGSLDWEPSDRSLHMHACHGATRQVEVLRDAILHLLAAPELGLREEDIVVICPALDRFAPLVEGVFGPSADTGAAASVGALGSPLLRYRIADRSLSEVNPVLSAMASLIALASGRFDATSVLDFISLAPVRRRFGFDDDDLATIVDWVERAQVRWGLTPDHRLRFGVPVSITTNTWQSALDRLLLGSAISDDLEGLAIGDVAVVGVEGGDTATLGRLAELLWRLSELATAFCHEHSITEWIALLREQASDLFDTPNVLRWQMDALYRALADVEANATAGDQPSPVALTAIDIRRMFSDHLGAAEGRPDFFRGGITVTTLKPLRGIPFRVVCVLGADESAIGTGATEGDDLAALAPALGDPDQRTDDRQSLLEAVLAARDAVVVVREGHDVRTNQAIPRAVVLEELRDAAMATVSPGTREALCQGLELHHPRQAFDERCFVVGAPWSFGENDRLGAQARRGRSDDQRPFLTVPLPEQHDPVVELADLHSFLRHPVTWFVSRRLHARLHGAEESRNTQLPVAPNALEMWQLGDGLLSARRAGMSTKAWERIERQRGTIPPASIGDDVIARVSAAVDQLLEATQTLGVAQGPGTDVPIDVVLPGGVRLVGQVPTHLLSPRDGPVLITYSKAKAAQQVAAWLDLMALVAAEPETDWQSVAVTRTGQSRLPVKVDVARTRAGSGGVQASAHAALEVIVDCYRRGNVEPLPLVPSFSEKVYLHQAKPPDWQRDHATAERRNLATALVYGEYDFDQLMALPAHDDDPTGSGGRVQRFADYLYGAMAASITFDGDP
jgi:exodeoxyribonuclease V gamma subunit